MTTPHAASGNFAADASHVGVQAGTVHGDVWVYQVPEDASPEQKYRIGVNYLDGGMPMKACELINEAIARGYCTSEVWFHWLLAMLSGRTQRQFLDEDLARLRSARQRIPADSGDAWSDGVRLILQLLDSLESLKNDLRLIIKELDELDRAQRDKILRHLELLLKGPLTDQMWARELDRVKSEQKSNDREGRVWMFFEPSPAKPRVRPPRPVSTTVSDWALAITTTGVTVLAVGRIGWILLMHQNVTALLAYLVGVAGGCACVASGLEWRGQVARLQAEDMKFQPPILWFPAAPPGGFANQVDKLFDRYFARYVPDGLDRKAWLAKTVGIRRYLRDEIVEVYRETRVSAKEIAWLVRYRVGRVRHCWQTDELLSYRQKFRVRPATVVVFGFGVAALLLGGGYAIRGAAQAELLSTSLSVFFALVAGLVTAKRWLRIALERRRFAAEQEESQRRLADSFVAYDRWRAKLAPKPTDSQMASWLDCDRKVLVGLAMQHYKLARSDVIADAFLEAPATASKRARVRNGPWRYSKYRILVFLLTTDGVRQVAVDLNFGDGSFHDWARTNYRFDAIAAIRVSETDDHQRTFDLGLVNGESINVRVTESNTAQQLQQGEDADLLSSVALDATGLTNTLHVLEGIAAEGKEWIRREKPGGAPPHAAHAPARLAHPLWLSAAARLSPSSRSGWEPGCRSGHPGSASWRWPRRSG